MKEFNLDEYLKDPSQNVITRDGREVRIICTNAKGEEPIVALLYNENRDEENVYTYNRVGYFYKDNDSCLDLFFTSIKRERWVNIYEGKNDTRTIGCLFDSEEEANLHKYDRASVYIKTIKIEWEE